MQNWRLLRILVLVCATLLASISAASTADSTRVALVIGNSRYASVDQLSNPASDSQAFAATLKAMGFQTVQLVRDLTRDQMLNQLAEFSRVAETAEWAVIYYAGHGIEIGGTNFLIPVDARIVADVDMEQEAINLDRVLSSVSFAKQFRLIILDACRENPFLSQMKHLTATPVSSGGLANVLPAAGTLVAYAAGQGQIAFDGKENSPFVSALIKHLRTPGLEVDRLFRLVRDDVVKATNGQQQPHVYGSLTADSLYFVEAQASHEPTVDEVAWELIKDSSDVNVLRAFARQFRESPWHAAAVARIDAIDRAEWRVAYADTGPPETLVRRVIIGGSVKRPTKPLTISCGTFGVELEACKKGVEAWSRRTGVEVLIEPAPRTYEERLALYQTILARNESPFDVIQVDVTWTGPMADRLTDLRPLIDGHEKRFFPKLIENNTVDDRVVALPWFLDAGLIFYRKDLLAKYKRPLPTDWDELVETARIIQDGERKAGGKDFWGFVFQARNAESLTCFIIEITNSFGFNFLADSASTLAKLRDAITFSVKLVGDITPESVFEFDEEASREFFQAGNAAFMRNWPYVLKLANEDSSPVKNKVGFMVIPKAGMTGNRSGTLGGWQLAVPRGSSHKALAADLVAYLTDSEEQKRRALADGFAPTIGSLYRDPDVLAVNPLFPDLFTAVTNATPRPSRELGSRYEEFSTELRTTFRDTLLGKIGVDDGAREMFLLR